MERRRRNSRHPTQSDATLACARDAQQGPQKGCQKGASTLAGTHASCAMRAQPRVCKVRKGARARNRLKWNGGAVARTPRLQALSARADQLGLLLAAGQFVWLHYGQEEFASTEAALLVGYELPKRRARCATALRAPRSRHWPLRAITLRATLEPLVCANRAASWPRVRHGPS